MQNFYFFLNNLLDETKALQYVSWMDIVCSYMLNFGEELRCLVSVRLDVDLMFAEFLF